MKKTSKKEHFSRPSKMALILGSRQANAWNLKNHYFYTFSNSFTVLKNIYSFTILLFTIKIYILYIKIIK